MKIIAPEISQYEGNAVAVGRNAAKRGRVQRPPTQHVWDIMTINWNSRDEVGIYVLLRCVCGQCILPLDDADWGSGLRCEPVCKAPPAHHCTSDIASVKTRKLRDQCNLHHLPKISVRISVLGPYSARIAV